MENDLKNVLKEDAPEKTNSATKEEQTIRVHKKPMQLRDIESRSSNTNREHKIETPEQIKQLLNDEKDLIFKKPWNRLDMGMKLNRIRLFSESQAKEHKLSKEKQEELRKILADACRGNKLNKLPDVNYDTELCSIIAVKNLEIKDGKIYFNLGEVKKAKKTTKTKSNIDRLLTKKS
jgi:hypothetical protein|tara:strand:+ start:724 stop:1254 length:531 start_codon:yes stop_codon:yes gene_type:complete